METSIKKNYFFQLIYQILMICVPLITTPYVSRVLHAEGIGQYSHSFSIASYFAIFGTLGISTYGQLKVSEKRANKYELSMLFWELVIARILTTLAVVLLYILGMPFLCKAREIYLVQIIYLSSTIFDISWFLQGLELFKITVTRNSVIKILSTICIFLFVKNERDLIIYILILHCSTLVGNLSLWPYAKRHLAKIEWKKLRSFRHWKYSVSYFIPTIATSVYTILDKSMIGWITKMPAENGYYEQAQKIEGVLVAILTSLGVVTLPRIHYMFSNGDVNRAKQLITKTINYIFMVSMPMCIGFIVVADKFVPLFLGSEFEKSVFLVQIFSVLIVIIGLDNVIGRQCLMAVGRQKYYNVGVVIGACVNFCSNIILINKWQSIGAAIASLFAEGTILLCFIYFGKEYIEIVSFWQYLLKYLIISLIMGTIAFSIGNMFSAMDDIIIMGIQIVSGVFIYLLLLLMTRDKLFLEECKKIFNRLIKNRK